MDDFDIFTDEIQFTKPLYKNTLDKYVNEVPGIPSGPNYQSSRKLMADECLCTGDEAACAFYLSEAVSASLRTMAIYRDEQMKAAGNNLHKITSFIKPVQDLLESNSISKKRNDILENDSLLKRIIDDSDGVLKTLQSFKIDEEQFHKRYLRFSPENNVENLRKILKELPKEWTIVQLTAPYNANENFKSFDEYRTEIYSIYVTMYTNDYLDEGPITVNIPANVHKEGELPLFTELYSLLDKNYETIDNAQFLNNKKLVQNYWARREEIDLRMKSVIMVMDKEWLGGFGSLLTGKLVEPGIKEKVIKAVDTTISDWGFIKLTSKQKILLYNVFENCPMLSSQQIKSCIRRILTEHGNTEDVREILDNDCQCNKDFTYLYELCRKCLSKAFECIHHFTLVDGIKAFSQLATHMTDNDEWVCLKNANRYPVILIVDEMLDTFPWETLPILNHHPVSRMENIHFLYTLYKIHEKQIVDGYFVANADVGRYVINPDKNLDRMEKRMSSFVNYWCSSWSGHVGDAPPPDCYLRYLTEADVFLYCGHGDGCQLGAGGAGGVGVEGAAGTRALAVLSGCGSVRLSRAAGRTPPAAAHHHLHIAGSPMVVGMLWEVTDLEVDKMVSTLVSLYVPSGAPAAWHSVGKTNWSQGLLDTNVEQKTPVVQERDLLRAVSRARSSTNFVMIASSMVARGLPVRIPLEK